MAALDRRDRVRGADRRPRRQRHARARPGHDRTGGRVRRRPRVAGRPRAGRDPAGRRPLDGAFARAHARSGGGSERAEGKLERRKLVAQRTYLETLAALSRSMQRGDGTDRPEWVRRLSVELARARSATGRRGLEAMRSEPCCTTSASLDVPERILNKPGPLTAAEWEEMRRQPVASDSMLAELELHPFVRQIARLTHERIDGTGYPDGLAGEEIPLPARIVLVADAFDALARDRPHRPARPVCRGARRAARERRDAVLPDAFSPRSSRSSRQQPERLHPAAEPSGPAHRRRRSSPGAVGSGCMSSPRGVGHQRGVYSEPGVGLARQTEIYLAGVRGRRPAIPFDHRKLERQAKSTGCRREAFAYIAGGAGHRAHDARRTAPRSTGGGSSRGCSATSPTATCRWSCFGRRLPDAVPARADRRARARARRRGRRASPGPPRPRACR